MVSSQRQNGGTERGPEYSGNSVDMPLRFYESKLKGSAHLFSFDGVGVQRVRDAPAISAFVLWSSHGLALGNEWLGLFCVGRDLKSPFSHFPLSGVGTRFVSRPAGSFLCSVDVPASGGST